MHPRYDEWLQHVFAHRVSDPAWHFDLDAPYFVADERDIAELLVQTFSHAGRDLSAYTDAQVNQGIWYLASPTCSDYMFDIRDGDIPVESKVQVIQSIQKLYTDCFAARCTETLAHRGEPGQSDLNPICFMFWDICPLKSLPRAPDRVPLEEALFDLLANTLEIQHRACREAALHGLGEIAYEHPTRVKKMIDGFLRRTRLDPALREYAQNAREGAIL